MASVPKVMVTGASGLLGRALMRELQDNGAGAYEVVGTAFSRATDVLRKVDLTDPAAVEELVVAEAPRVIVHAAAERRPDVCEGDADATRKLNVEAVTSLAKAAGTVGAWVIGISTDYVFDGTSPPYKVDDEPKPLNSYGVSKRAGEVALLEANPDAAVLRVPVLFGHTKDLSESAVTVVAQAVRNEARKETITVDGWGQRFPTFTDDVAVVIRGMIDAHVSGTPLKGIFHWSGDERLTKYDQAIVMGRVLGCDTAHLVASRDPPGGAPRPRDCCMDVSRLTDAGVATQRTPFEVAIAAVLRGCLGDSVVAGAGDSGSGDGAGTAAGAGSSDA